jgi:hypothetical protein
MRGALAAAPLAHSAVGPETGFAHVRTRVRTRNRNVLKIYDASREPGGSVKPTQGTGRMSAHHLPGPPAYVCPSAVETLALA